MTKQKTRGERALVLKLAAASRSSRGAGSEGTARARRSSESDMSIGLRLGDGLEVVDGKISIVLGAGLKIDASGRVALI
jgi:hypothetical protein